MIVALCGGVGAARFLSGLVTVIEESDVTAVVNTGDDLVLHGLSISPDLDTVTYTLAGAINSEAGWGLGGETWNAMSALERYGGEAWFRLGDADLGTHLYRTQRLAAGASLSTVASEIAAAWAVGVRIVPMSDERVETRVMIGGDDVGFQHYFVGMQHAVPIERVRFAGVDDARPAPGVLEAISTADAVIVCPSNPIVSIGPILAVPGIHDVVQAHRDRTVAISPIVGGKALKGPADRMLVELGHEPSVVGVARLYASLAATLVIDEVDASMAADVEREGVRCVVTGTVMNDAASATALADTAIEAAMGHAG